MDLILSDERVRKLEQILDQELLGNGVDHVFVIDSSGNLITQGGKLEVEEILALASLSAANFRASEKIAELIGEKEFTLMFHKGRKYNIHFSRINDGFILVNLFSGGVSLGLIRLGSSRAAKEMAPILAA
jgi:predicted regulator of Ras-like GTPase activity (Roadblock/LC7/MglB family)